MKKLESNFRNMVLVLFGITIFSAVVLSSVYSLTKESIDQKKNSRQMVAIRSVLPPYDHLDTTPVEMNDGVEITRVFKAYNKNNEIVGAAVESSSNNGYKGHIDIVVGFNKKGVIIDYEVLDQNETLGLGSKMVNWFKTNKAKQSIIGKNASTANLNLIGAGGEIDAITAATISSRAFMFAVRNAYYAFKSDIEAHINVTNNVADSLHHVKTDSTSTHSIFETKGQHQ